MYRIALINMPFASASFPSIALTQLKSVLERELGDRVTTEVLYFHHDFARLMGAELYGRIAEKVDAVTSGLGDWFFRHLAFPDLADNSKAYFRRHFAANRQELERIQEPLFDARQKAGTLLDELIDRHQLERCSLVGLTSMFSQNVACIALVNRLKMRKPEIVTVMGGANCETPMGQVIAKNVESVDFVFSGPSLETFPKLVRHQMAGEREKCHELRGVFSRQRLDREGALQEVGDELDIDVTVPLDFDDFIASLDAAFPNGDVEPSLLFETSRGCWWGERSHCTFCGLNGMTMKYRAMAPPKALAMLADLFDRYGSRFQFFQSVDNILPREYLTEVLPHLRPPENVSIFYEVKADLKEHEMAVLAAANVTAIQPGIEALATSTLKLMRKGTTSFQNIRFLKSCLAYGIDPFWNLLIGFPGEEEDVYKKYVDDLPNLVHLPPPSGVFPVRFDRYSPYYTLAKEYGLKLRAADFYRMIYPFDPEDLEHMAYYFANQDYGASYLQATAKWFVELQRGIDYWRARSSRRDRGVKPKLELAGWGESRVVVDTRSGEAVEHDLGAKGLRVLELLAKPMKLHVLAKRLPDISADELRRLIAVLEEHRLLFRERGLYLSLVIAPQAADSVRMQHGERSDGVWSSAAPPA